MNETVPSIEQLIGRKVTSKEWLNYYRNVWLRNAVARAVDVKCDSILAAKNPEDMVMEYEVETGAPTGEKIPVKVRLETRKLLVQDALDVVESVDALLKEEETSYFGKEALAPAVEEKKEAPATPANGEGPAGEAVTPTTPASDEAKV